MHAIVKFVKLRTKNKAVQTFVWHIFINQHSFIAFNAATYELDKITVLKFGNQHNFIFELLQPLTRLLWKPFHSKLLPILQSSLQTKLLEIFLIKENKYLYLVLHITLYTGPKPPSPNLLLSAKFSVALAMIRKSNVDKSMPSFLSLCLKCFL